MTVKIGSDFPVDSSFPGDRASLHFEERSGDTSNFPKTLHNFSTSSARWHQNIMPGNILTCWFYLQKFHSLFKPSAIFDHKRYFFDLLTIKTTIRCTPCNRMDYPQTYVDFVWEFQVRGYKRIYQNYDFSYLFLFLCFLYLNISHPVVLFASLKISSK